MTVVDFNFSRAYTPPPSNAVDMNFGVEGDVVADPLIAVVSVYKAAPKLSVATVYNSRVSRPVTASPDIEWQQADEHAVTLESPWQATEPLRKQASERWEQALAANASMDVLAEFMQPLNLQRSTVWQQAKPVHGFPIDELFMALLKTDFLKDVPWQQAQSKPVNKGDSFVQLRPFNRVRGLPWQQGTPAGHTYGMPFNRAGGANRTASIPWEITRQPPPGREPPYVQPPEQPFTPECDLNFQCKWVPGDPLNVILNFGKHPCPPLSPVLEARKVYIIVNNLSMKRVDDNTPIELVSASVGTDKDSWCWSFSGSVPYYEFEKIEPGISGPVEVELNINGIKWRLLIEKYNTKELFANTDVSISGRSVTAWLDSPYAPVRSFAQSTTLSSRQFAEAELVRTGLVTGFTLDWRMIDALGWQMPANTWSYTDLTPVAVVQAIAQGAGGYVNSHPLNRELIVMPEYEIPYWEWAGATPALTIPDDLVMSRGLDWEERPFYDGVWVSGEATGVSDFVKRTGSSGSNMAPAYVNAMISDHAAARQKGMSILSASGRQARVSLDLPMEPGLGLVQPGMLIQVQKDVSNNWRGLVRSTQISASWSESLTVGQTISLERHYGGI